VSTTNLDRAAARVAWQEWWYFGSQYVAGESSSLPIKKAPDKHGTTGKEASSGYRQRVYTYFKAGVYPDSNKWKDHKDDAWSAAFISFCMRNAGADGNFPYSIGHHRYVSAAIRNREAGNVTNTIVAYRHGEIAPSIGDLLWRGRKPQNGMNTSKWTYDDILDYINKGGGGFPSHCDLVTEIIEDAEILHAIGGNVANRVLRMQSKIDEEGMLVDSRYRVIIRNNITE